MITTDTPDQETVSAMLEAERIAQDSSVKGYSDMDELFADLKNDRVSLLHKFNVMEIFDFLTKSYLLRWNF